MTSRHLWTIGAGSLLLAIAAWFLLTVERTPEVEPTSLPPEPGTLAAPATTTPDRQPEPDLVAQRRETQGAEPRLQPGTGGLRVRVIDDNDQPLAGIPISLNYDRTRRQRTDKAGTVRFVDLFPGARYIVEHDLWNNAWVSIESGRWTEVTLRLGPPLRLSILVVDQREDPVAECPVRLTDPVGNLLQTLVTDPEGRCRIERAPSNAVLNARHRNKGGADTSLRHFALGDHDIVLRLKPARRQTPAATGVGTLTVIVRDDLQAPVTPAVVRARNAEDPYELFEQSTDTTGRCVFRDLPVGSWQLTAESARHEITGSAAEVLVGAQEHRLTTPRLIPVEIFATVDDEPAVNATALGNRQEMRTDSRGHTTVLQRAGRVDLICFKPHVGQASTTIELVHDSNEPHRWHAELEPGETIAGRVVDEHGRPAAGWEVRANTGAGVRTLRDGRFRLTRLKPGDHTLLVSRMQSTQDTGTVASAVVSTGTEDCEIIVDRSTLTGVIRGQLVARDPAWFRQIGVTLTSEALRRRRQVQVHADGQFETRSLPPGTYQLNIVATGSRRQPAFAPYRIRDLTLGHGEVRDLGTLELGEGLPIRLRLRGLTSWTGLRAEIAHADGRFVGSAAILPDGTLRVLGTNRYRAGSYWLIVRAANVDQRPHSFRVTANGTSPPTIAIAEGTPRQFEVEYPQSSLGQIRVDVSDASGQSVLSKVWDKPQRARSVTLRPGRYRLRFACDEVTREVDCTWPKPSGEDDPTSIRFVK